MWRRTLFYLFVAIAVLRIDLTMARRKARSSLLQSPFLPRGVGNTLNTCIRLEETKIKQVRDYRCSLQRDEAAMHAIPHFGAPPGLEEPWIPRCVNGSLTDSFEAIQCHDSRMECWCSTKRGEEIRDTRAVVGDVNAPNITCSYRSSDLLECSRARDLAINTNIAPKQNFVPACDEKGGYSRRQCFDFAHFCFCVTPGWKYIPRTMHRRKEAGYCDRLIDVEFPCGNPQIQGLIQHPNARLPEPEFKDRYFNCGWGTTYLCSCQKDLEFFPALKGSSSSARCDHRTWP